MLSWIKNLFNLIIPPQNWIFSVAFVCGLLVGIVLLIFKISNAYQYLSEKPQACINCHVMHPQYVTWRNSSHANVATCNDCHVPQNNFLHKIYFKANDGLRHSIIFTLRKEPQVIRIKEAGKNVVQENCIRCHENYIDQTSLLKIIYKTSGSSKEKYCWDCHIETPHGKVNSLASTPYARVPKLNPVLPEWMEKIIKQN